MGYVSRMPLGSQPRWTDEREAILEQIELAGGAEPVTTILRTQLAELDEKNQPEEGLMEMSMIIRQGTSYRVKGRAHGEDFDEGGFATRDAAERYASAIIDGDFDSTVEVTREETS